MPSSLLQQAEERERLTLRSAEPLAAGKQDSSGSGSGKTPVSQHWQEEWGRGDEKFYSPAVCCRFRYTADLQANTSLLSFFNFHGS